MDIPDGFHLDRVQVVDVVPLGRSSSIFFQGLFDGHPSFVTLPLHVLAKSGESGNPPDAQANRLWSHLVSGSERYGIGSAKIDRDAFVEGASRYLERFGTDEYACLIALHYGYVLACGRDPGRIRYVCTQSHSLKRLIGMIRRFSSLRVVFTLRDPRASFASIKKRGDLNPLRCLAMFDVFYKSIYRRMRNEVQDRVILVRHEDLHLDYGAVRARLLRFLDISDDPALDGSSYFGVPFTGEDLRSRSTIDLYASQPDPRYVHDRWTADLTDFELATIQRMAERMMHENGYDPIQTSDLGGDAKAFDYSRVLRGWRRSMVRWSASARSVYNWIHERIALNWFHRIYQSRTERGLADFEFSKQISRGDLGVRSTA